MIAQKVSCAKCNLFVALLAPLTLPYVFSFAGSKITAKISHQKESVAKNTKILFVAADSRRNVMKQYGNRASAASSDMDKSSCPSSPMNSNDSQGRNKVKGKVKEFVKMFNQDTSSEIKDTVSLQSRSSTSKGDGVNNDHITTAQMPKLTQPPNASKMVLVIHFISISVHLGIQKKFGTG